MLGSWVRHAKALGATGVSYCSTGSLVFPTSTRLQDNSIGSAIGDFIPTSSRQSLGTRPPIYIKILSNYRLYYSFHYFSRVFRAIEHVAHEE